MVTQNNARSITEAGQQLRDLDVFGPEFANDFRLFAYTRPDALKELLKAAAQGKSYLADPLLRHWGIW